MKRNQKGFTFVEILLTLVVVTLLAGAGFLVYRASNKTSNKSQNHTSKKSNVVVLSPQQVNQAELINTSKFSETIVDIRYAVYDHEISVNPKCVGMENGYPVLVDANGKVVDVALNNVPSVPGYAIIKYDFCEPATQLYGITSTPADGSDGWHFVADTDTYFKCSDLQTYKVPSGALSKPSCLDSAGQVVSYSS